MNSAAHASFRCPTSQLTMSFESASIAVHVHTLPMTKGDDSRISCGMFRSFP
jgi:hypothetical protein